MSRPSNDTADAISIYHHPRFSEDDLKTLRGELQKVSPQVELLSVEPGIQMSAEWALPALIAILIGKPFIEPFIKAFMGKLGAEAAEAFKAELKRLYDQGRGKELTWSNADQMREAADRLKAGESDVEVAGKKSPTLTFDFHLTSGSSYHRIKCVYPAGLSKEQSDRAVELHLRYLEVLLERERALAKELEGRERYIRDHVYTYANDNEDWIVAYPLQERELKMFEDQDEEDKDDQDKPGPAPETGR